MNFTRLNLVTSLELIIMFIQVNFRRSSLQWYISTETDISTEQYPESSQTSEMDHFPRIVKGFYPLTIIVKRFILDLW